MAEPVPARWAERVLQWYAEHGRHDLPWQHPRSPYRVWLSEIMLQQTTVQTVKPYFERFIARFPDINALAAAPQDDVLALWSGLGYYARARNLHRAAQQIVKEHGGEFPDNMAAIEALPGVGRSTAAAILAQAFNQPAAILDGNVKRVLARHAGIEGWAGESSVLKTLWVEAELRLPEHSAVEYAQGMMDLGATLCKRRKPHCLLCPVQEDCQARLLNKTAELPTPRPKKARPLRQSVFWCLRNEQNEILLQKRPATGIWGGLWCLLEAEDLARLPGQERPETGFQASGATMRHEFTHFSLDMEFRQLKHSSPQIADEAGLQWFALEQALQLGLPKPIKHYLEELTT